MWLPKQTWLPNLNLNNIFPSEKHIREKHQDNKKRTMNNKLHI